MPFNLIHYKKNLKNAGLAMLHESSREISTNEQKSLLYQCCAGISGPILCSYILWVLKNALEEGISCLYFMARDGKVMYQIACEFVAMYQLPIECRYLYCSRFSLRKPLYFLDRQEALDKLCIDGMKTTAYTVLQRSGLPYAEQLAVLDDLGISKKEGSIVLSHRGLMKLKEELSRSILFDQYMTIFSRKSFESIVMYFTQEGLMDAKKYAFVDSGWTGSMQRSIRKILEGTGCQRLLQGFYFGMFNKTVPKDGVYHCFAFSGTDRIWNSILFNHNLFECWCMADHGMTTGYGVCSTGVAIPVLKVYQPVWYEKEQLTFHALYAKHLSRLLDWNEIKKEVLCMSVQPLFRLTSIFPRREIALLYGEVPFCDDSSESYQIPLAEAFSFGQLSQNLLIKRLYTKFIAPNKRYRNYDSYWPEATISLLPWHQRWLFRMDKGMEYLLKAFRKSYQIHKSRRRI